MTHSVPPTEGVTTPPTVEITGLHIGRSWEGNRLERECPCALAPCGLAISDSATACPEHGYAAAKTIRQGHYAEDCLGEATA